MADERYGLYGVVTEQRDFNEAGDYKKQSAGEGGSLIYETDDREEARAIYQAGGFERGGVWHAVTRVEDRTKGQKTMVQPGAASTQRQPSKRDYDQS